MYILNYFLHFRFILKVCVEGAILVILLTYKKYIRPQLIQLFHIILYINLKIKKLLLHYYVVCLAKIMLNNGKNKNKIVQCHCKQQPQYYHHHHAHEHFKMHFIKIFTKVFY